MPHRVIRTISGRRGSVLTIMGATFALVSVWQIMRENPDWTPHWLSVSAMGWGLLGCSVFAFASGLFSKRLPKGALSHGYAAAFIPPLAYAVLYTLAAILGATPGAFLFAAVFSGFAAIVYLVSGWEEPPPHAPLTDEQRQIVGGGDA